MTNRENAGTLPPSLQSRQRPDPTESPDVPRADHRLRPRARPARRPPAHRGRPRGCAARPQPHPCTRRQRRRARRQSRGGRRPCQHRADPPGRLVFLSSGMHLGGGLDLDDLQWTRRRWNPSRAYAQSKLLDVTLAFALARRWPGVPSNAVDPGWVPTRMGGPDASDDLDLGVQTQVWLATGDDPEATRTGRYLYHRRPY